MGKGYTVLKAGEQEFQPPSWRGPEDPRRILELPLHAEMQHSRAHIWRYPHGVKGRRHLHQQQEEVFVVLEGTMTMLLGEERERVELPPQSVVVLSPGTPIHLMNESGKDAVLFIYGAPPVMGDGVILEG
jgi:mannose-6-phosphate isomerase-like protein (cupin superfamily)